MVDEEENCNVKKLYTLSKQEQELVESLQIFQINEVFEFPKIRKVRDSEMVIYRLGDHVYDKADKHFGKILKILIINDRQVAMLKCFKYVGEDGNTAISYVNRNDSYDTCAYIESLSNPMVVGQENDNLWFLGVYSSFSWNEEHIRL